MEGSYPAWASLWPLSFWFLVNSSMANSTRILCLRLPCREPGTTVSSRLSNGVEIHRFVSCFWATEHPPLTIAGNAGSCICGANVACACIPNKVCAVNANMSSKKDKKREKSEGRKVTSIPPLHGTPIPRICETGFPDDCCCVQDYTWSGWPSVIAHVRETTGLDQTDFGQMLGGWSRSQVARWEKGDSDPQVAFWINFTKATSLSLTWVFTGLGSPYEYLLQEYDDHHGFMRWVYVESERQLLSGGHPEPRTRRGVEYLQVRTKGDSETESGGEDTGELSGGVSRSPKAQKTKKPKRQ